MSKFNHCWKSFWILVLTFAGTLAIADASKSKLDSALNLLQAKRGMPVPYLGDASVSSNLGAAILDPVSRFLSYSQFCQEDLDTVKGLTEEFRSDRVTIERRHQILNNISETVQRAEENLTFDHRIIGKQSPFFGPERPSLLNRRERLELFMNKLLDPYSVTKESSGDVHVKKNMAIALEEFGKKNPDIIVAVTTLFEELNTRFSECQKLLSDLKNEAKPTLEAQSKVDELNKPWELVSGNDCIAERPREQAPQDPEKMHMLQLVFAAINDLQKQGSETDLAEHEQLLQNARKEILDLALEHMSKPPKNTAEANSYRNRLAQILKKFERSPEGFSSDWYVKWLYTNEDLRFPEKENAKHVLQTQVLAKIQSCRQKSQFTSATSIPALTISPMYEVNRQNLSKLENTASQSFDEFWDEWQSARKNIPKAECDLDEVVSATISPIYQHSDSAFRELVSQWENFHLFTGFMAQVKDSYLQARAKGDHNPEVYIKDCQTLLMANLTAWGIGAYRSGEDKLLQAERACTEVISNVSRTEIERYKSDQNRKERQDTLRSRLFRDFPGAIVTKIDSKDFLGRITLGLLKKGKAEEKLVDFITGLADKEINWEKMDVEVGRTTFDLDKDRRIHKDPQEVLQLMAEHLSPEEKAKMLELINNVDWSAVKKNLVQLHISIELPQRSFDPTKVDWQRVLLVSHAGRADAKSELYDIARAWNEAFPSREVSIVKIETGQEIGVRKIGEVEYQAKVSQLLKDFDKNVKAFREKVIEVSQKELGATKIGGLSVAGLFEILPPSYNPVKRKAFQDQWERLQQITREAQALHLPSQVLLDMNYALGELGNLDSKFFEEAFDEAVLNWAELALAPTAVIGSTAAAAALLRTLGSSAIRKAAAQQIEKAIVEAGGKALSKAAREQIIKDVTIREAQKHALSMARVTVLAEGARGAGHVVIGSAQLAHGTAEPGFTVYDLFDRYVQPMGGSLLHASAMNIAFVAGPSALSILASEMPLLRYASADSWEAVAHLGVNYHFGKQFVDSAEKGYEAFSNGGPGAAHAALDVAVDTVINYSLFPGMISHLGELRARGNRLLAIQNFERARAEREKAKSKAMDEIVRLGPTATAKSLPIAGQKTPSDVVSTYILLRLIEGAGRTQIQQELAALMNGDRQLASLKEPPRTVPKSEAERQAALELGKKQRAIFKLLVTPESEWSKITNPEIREWMNNQEFMHELKNDIVILELRDLFTKLKAGSSSTDEYNDPKNSLRRIYEKIQEFVRSGEKPTDLLERIRRARAACGV